MSKAISAGDVRQKLLDVAPSLIETADLLARGKLKDYGNNAQMLQALLRLVSPIVSLEDDRVVMDNMKPEYTTEERVDTITRALVEGTISLNQAKSMVDVLQRTSDIQDAQTIKTTLEMLANSV